MRLSLIHDKPLIWGHRGGRSLAPENTLLALRKGYESGFDGWELDVVLSKDGVPVLLHDLNLLRTTDARTNPHFANNAPQLPWRFTLEELKQLRAGFFPRRACGKKRVPVDCDSPALVEPVAHGEYDEKIPTLEEALLLSKELGVWVNVEIKDVSYAMPVKLADHIVNNTLDVIKKTGMEDQVIISSFNHDYVAKSKILAPHILTAVLTPHKFTGDPVEAVRKADADAWHPGFRNLTEEAIVAARNEGIAINPYTVNELKVMERLVQWGVTGLVTDCPQSVQHHVWK